MISKDRKTQTFFSRSNRASEAIETLLKLHTFKKRGPTAHSLFLGEILSRSSVSASSGSPGVNSDVSSANERALQSMVDSGVLSTSRCSDSWDWSLVQAAFKWPGEAMIKLEGQNHRLFLRRVVEFFKPSSNHFAKAELGTAVVNQMAKAGCRMLDFLLKAQQVRSKRSPRYFRNSLLTYFSIPVR